MESASASIDEKIKELGDWRGKTLAKVRDIIHEADPEIVEVSCHNACSCLTNSNFHDVTGFEEKREIARAISARSALGLSRLGF